MLSSKNRLKKKREFSFIYKKGKGFYSQNLSVYIYKTKYKFCKIGFSIGSKVGNSVVRHKIKRRLSEIVRFYIKNMPINNYVFVAKSGIEKVDYFALKNQVENLINKINLDKEKTEIWKNFYQFLSK